MIVYAIGDLHLPGGDDKPMAVFGAHWEGHWEKICQDWRARVTTQDVVLVPGDISWAMQLEHALDDLHAIAALPGRWRVLLAAVRAGGRARRAREIPRMSASTPGSYCACACR